MQVTNADYGKREPLTKYKIYKLTIQQHLLTAITPFIGKNLNQLKYCLQSYNMIYQ